MRRILATARTEMRIASRNRWVIISLVTVAGFSLILAAVGAAPTSGGLGADRLSVTVASLTSLSVYLVPLLALLMSFDAIAGEVERGTLPLLLTYPVERWEILVGKLLAHLVILSLAVVVGYGLAAIVSLGLGGGSTAGIAALWRLTWSSIFLGATFLGAGYAISATARRPSSAAGLAIGLWLGLVVLYDLALLAAIVTDGGGWFTQEVFPYALLANPADAFRLFNLTASGAMSVATGVGGAASTIPLWQSLIPILLWPCAGAVPGRQDVPKDRPMRVSALLIALALAGCKEEQAQNVDPLPLSADAVGHFCQMNLLEHDGPKAQVHLEGLPDAPLFFSQVRDAVAYTRLPEQTQMILAVWVNDMGAAGASWSDPGVNNWIRIEDAHLVVGSERIGGMGVQELVPFASREKAQDFMRDHGGSVMRLAEVPDTAVIAPDNHHDDDDSQFRHRLQELSDRSGG